LKILRSAVATLQREKDNAKKSARQWQAAIKEMSRDLDEISVSDYQISVVSTEPQKLLLTPDALQDLEVS
jgi:prefoldin subunit 5